MNLPFGKQSDSGNSFLAFDFFLDNPLLFLRRFFVAVGVGVAVRTEADTETEAEAEETRRDCCELELCSSASCSERSFDLCCSPPTSCNERSFDTVVEVAARANSRSAHGDSRIRGLSSKVGDGGRVGNGW